MGALAVMVTAILSAAATGGPSVGVPQLQPTVPDVQVPSVPDLPSVPNVPQAPSVQAPSVQAPQVQTPNLPSAPNVPGAPDVGSPGGGGGAGAGAGVPAGSPRLQRLNAAGVPAGRSGTASAAGSPASTSGASAQSGQAPEQVAARQRRRAAYERRLRRTVERLSDCLGAVSGLERKVLVLRGGLGARRARSRGAVAKRLGISRRRAARTERRGMRNLRRAKRDGNCGAAVLGTIEGSDGASTPDGSATVPALTALGSLGESSALAAITGGSDTSSDESSSARGDSDEGGKGQVAGRSEESKTRRVSLLGVQGALASEVLDPSGLIALIVLALVVLALLTLGAAMLTRRDRRPRAAHVAPLVTGGVAAPPAPRAPSIPPVTILPAPEPEPEPEAEESPAAPVETEPEPEESPAAPVEPEPEESPAAAVETEPEPAPETEPEPTPVEELEAPSTEIAPEREPRNAEAETSRYTTLSDETLALIAAGLVGERRVRKDVPAPSLGPSGTRPADPPAPELPGTTDVPSANADGAAKPDDGDGPAVPAERRHEQNGEAPTSSRGRRRPGGSLTLGALLLGALLRRRR